MHHDELEHRDVQLQLELRDEQLQRLLAHHDELEPLDAQLNDRRALFHLFYCYVDLQ